jgi:hypothetical protein
LDGREPLFIADYANSDRLTANLTVLNIILLSYGAVDEELDGLTAIRTRAVDWFHAKRRHTPPQRHYTLNAADKATPALRDRELQGLFPSVLSLYKISDIIFNQSGNSLPMMVTILFCSSSAS